jgi:hypothetical protein
MAATASLYLDPNRLRRAPHQSKLEPTSRSTRFVVTLRPFHTARVNWVLATHQPSPHQQEASGWPGEDLTGQ